MSAKVTFDYSKTGAFISADEVAFMKKQTLDAKDLLVSKTGAGNDFLGWIDLPINYDKDEFERIKKAAKKIQEELEAMGLGEGIGKVDSDEWLNWITSGFSVDQIAEEIKKRLEYKNLPVDSKDYEKLQYIDEETNELVYDKQEQKYGCIKDKRIAAS